jgi:UDP-N-acetylglucosamine--N-acetylmuramyl-(pentapeptide) pyrophosphoryl-undecaprenol N-acetylglucosamine transferase
MENKLVPAAGISLDHIAFAGLRGKGGFGVIRGAWQLFVSMFGALSILRKRGATAVLGMGGYVCLPGGWMAALLRKPLLLVNADAGILLSNRVLMRWARRIAFGFDGAAARATPRALVTGNPVRSEIETLPAPAERYAGRQGRLRVLVVGGSLGAQVLNKTLPGAMARLDAARRPRLVHQTGAVQAEAVMADYDKRGIQAEVRPFIDDMAAELAACDLVICRAGAVTVSELCAAGVPAVLVPLIVSTTSHQRDNAAWMAGHQAAIHLPQSELSADRLAALLGTLDRDALQAMAERARSLARPHAAQRVADEIELAVTTGGRT